jgi:hypothetical protein
MALETPILPAAIVGPVDVGRLIRELEGIDDAFLQLNLRKSGGLTKLPKTTLLLDQVVSENQLNLLQEADRKLLLGFLNEIHAHSPRIHASFGAAPTEVFLEKLMSWLRREINPWLLLTVGLQPNIGAGCVIRTNNRYFDMSLKQNFIDKRGLLIEKLIPDTVVAPPPAETSNRG